MEKLLTIIQGLENLKHLQAASQSEVAQAEKQLDLTFATDYKQYVQTYGAIIAKGIEFTGVNVPSRINVVDVTLNERKRENIPSSYYVMENIGIEGYLVLQNNEGKIASYCDGQIEEIAQSIGEYILSKQSKLNDCF